MAHRHRRCVDCGTQEAGRTYHGNVAPLPLCDHCVDVWISSSHRPALFDTPWRTNPFHRALTRLAWAKAGQKALSLTPTDGWLFGGCWTFADAPYAWAIRTRLYERMPVALVGLSEGPGGTAESMHANEWVGHSAVRIRPPGYAPLYLDALGISSEWALRRYWRPSGNSLPLHIVPMDRVAMRQQCPVWESASRRLTDAFIARLPSL